MNCIFIWKETEIISTYQDAHNKYLNVVIAVGYRLWQTFKMYSFCSRCRLAKEKTVYEQEVVKQGEKIDKMKADGKDEYDIKKQVRKLAK